MLVAGQVAGNWFVQRLVDSGFTPVEAVDQYNLIRNASGNENMIEITPDAAQVGEYHAIDRAELLRRRRPRSATLPTHREPISLENYP